MTDDLMAAKKQIDEMGHKTLSLCAPRRLSLDPVIRIRKHLMGPVFDLMAKMGREEMDTPHALVAVKTSDAFDPKLFNDGALNSAYSFLRHYAKKGPIYTVSSPLHMLLNDTGIKPNVPVKYFAAPAKTCYIEFDPPENRGGSGFKVYAEGRFSICEGCYVQERLHEKLPPVSKVFRESLELDPHKPTRQVFVGFTASPMKSEQATVFNDLVDYLTFYIQDEDESIESLLDRHVAYYSGAQSSGDGAETESFAQMYKTNIYHLAKIMFYINVERRQQVVVNEASDLEKRLESVANKKRRKLEQQRSRVYDRIVIGPTHYQPLSERLVSGDIPKGTKRPHYRSGYFGIRHVGTGQAKTATLVRVKESLVNEHLLDSRGYVSPKSYEIR